jgi:hypothetical protein
MESEQPALLAQRIAAEADRLLALSSPPARRQSVCCVGVWRAECCLVQLVRESGKMVAHAGFAHKGCRYLFIEEACYLMELGMLEICVDEQPISVQRAWWLLANALSPAVSIESTVDSDPHKRESPFPGWFPSVSAALDSYNGYARLRSMGLIVHRFDVYRHLNFASSDAPGDSVTDSGQSATASISSTSSLPNPGQLMTEEEYQAQITQELAAARAAYFAELQRLVRPLSFDLDSADMQNATQKVQNRIAYYCWLPARVSTFKRSQPVKPDFCAILTRISESVPNVFELEALRIRYQPIPIRFAVVPAGDGANDQIMFFDLTHTELPDLTTAESAQGRPLKIRRKGKV